MSKFNELVHLFNSYNDFSPHYTANYGNSFIISISIISVFLLMLTLTFNVKASNLKTSIVNFIIYTGFAALTSLCISFTVLFVSSHVGVYT